MEKETRCLHSGYLKGMDIGRPCSVPIVQSTSFIFESAQMAASLFELKEEGHFYSRMSNPTVSVLEERIAALENGIGAVAFASGQAALTSTIITLLKPGEKVIASSKIYGGTLTLLKYSLAKLGYETTFVEDINDCASWEGLIDDKTRLVVAETIGNPSLDVLDIENVAKTAHRHNLLLLVDNTFASPYLANPKKWGADIVMHSATKYLSGHGTSIGGIVIDTGRHDWATSPAFKEFTEPSLPYHGIVYAERFGEKAFLTKLRAETLRDFGACLSPFNAYLILLGIETLHLRMQRHSENAMQVAQFLSAHNKVKRVYYPGLKSNPDYSIAQKVLDKGLFGGMVCFEIQGNAKDGARFVENLRLFYHLANIGDAKSLVIHPASTTHQQLTKEELEKCGISEAFIRLSIGIENIDDIITDIEQALAKI